MKIIIKSVIGAIIFSVLLVGALPRQVPAKTKTQGDFNLSNRFSLEIDGVALSGVESVKDIESSVAVVEYKDGEDGVSHTRPGNHKPGRMTITRDWSNTMEFYRWMNQVISGKVERKSISIIFHNDAGITVAVLTIMISPRKDDQISLNSIHKLSKFQLGKLFK